MDAWNAEWSIPVFSLAERDRRWRRVRELMAGAGTDVIVCLPHSGNHDRAQQDARYLTQLGENADETTVVFPADGPVTAWLTRGGAWPSSNWLADIRPTPRGTGGRAVIARLGEMGVTGGTIGIAGLTSCPLSHVRAAEGEANWQSVEMIRQAFPQARIVSATEVLAEARYQKSEEEIDFLARGTGIAEATLLAAAATARPGVRERRVFAEMMRTNADAGGSFTPMLGWTSGPLGAPYHRLEQPSFRTFAAGDVLVVEIEGRWGGYIGQIDDELAIGPAHPDLREGMKLAWESFDRVMDVLRPGATVADLLRAARVTGMNGRGVARLGMHGRGTGDDGPLVTDGVPDEILGVELREGCVMVVKPYVDVDGRPDYGRWGDTVVVRPGGAVRLGHRPRVLHECR